MDKYANLDKLARGMGYPNGIGLDFCMAIHGQCFRDMARTALSNGLSSDEAVCVPGEYEAFMNGMRALLAPARP